MPGRVNGFSLAYTAAGAVVLWSGITGEPISDTFRGLLSGQAPRTNSEKIDTTSASKDSGSGPGSAAGGSAAAGFVSGALSAVTGGGGTPAANKALGALMASAYGWGPGSTDWPYLESGWQEESGWSQTAANVPSDPYDHAYGIPQANPGSKMASAGADWKTNPATQIKWGLGYIKDRYGRPSQVPGWTPDGPAAGYVGY